MKISPVVYLYADPQTEGLFFSLLEDHFQVKSHQHSQTSLTYFDTFDWALLSKSCLLFATEQHLHLNKFTGEALAPPLFISTRNSRFKSTELPSSALGEALFTSAPLRALLPLAHLTRNTRSLTCHDLNQKTVLRIKLETFALDRDPSSPFIRTITLEPLRGYAASFSRVVEALSKIGIHPGQPHQHLALLAFKAAGHQPLGYSSEIELSLDPLSGTRDAARQIHQHSLSIVRANLPGMLEDIDCEFLHDFRIAIRRARSALSLLKGVYPPAEVITYKQHFSQMGRYTNLLRDLDVQLSQRSDYLSLLPPDLHPAAELFFEQIQLKREGAVRKMQEELAKEKIEPVLNQWEEFLLHPPPPNQDCPRALQPIGEVSRKLLAKQMARIYRQSAPIDQSTPDAELHEIRIEFKKIRYLTEFFRSLYPPEALQTVLKRLRKLQNLLGEFNDLAVQRTALGQRLQSPSLARHPDGLQIAAVIGALLQNFANQQTALRQAVLSTFASLRDPQMLRAVETLWGSRAIPPGRGYEP
ncbi:MAG: CHAD domain-containing protein [Puniceicoccaceae bacterium]